MEQPKKTWDIRDISKLGTGTLLAGAAGLAFFVYLLPVLAATAWTGVKLIWGLASLGGSLALFTSKRFWSFLKMFNAKIAKILTFWFITWDEFLLQEMEIKQAEKDREVIKEQQSKLEGQVYQKDEELANARVRMKEAEGLVKELESQGRTDDPEFQLYANSYMRQQEYIKAIEPLRNQIDELAKLLGKVYKATGAKILDAREELGIQKSKFKSLVDGEKAMNSAMSIFAGESDDVLMAKENVKRIIGEKIGSIRTSLDVINPIMNERALKDKVRVKLALEQMKTISIDQFQTVQPSMIPKESTYSNLLDK